MGELTREQQRALALARARQRAAQGSSEPKPEQSWLGGMVDSVTQGASMGFGDELTAAEAALLGRTPEGGWFDYSQPMGERYNRALEAERGQQAQFSEANPVASTTAEIVGALGTAGGLARQGATLVGRSANPAVRAGFGGAEGAAYGGAAGAGYADEGSRAEGAMWGAGTGAAAGGALTAAGDKVARALSRRAQVKAAPSSKDLMAQGGARLSEARSRNASFDGLDRLAMDVYATLGEEAFDPKLHPGMASWVNSLEELTTGGTKPTYRQLETLRKRLRTPLGNFSNPEEKRLAMIARQKLDDFMAQSGDDTVREGRELYRRGKNTQMIENALVRADDRAATTYGGGNVENAQRQQLRRILDSDKLKRGFRPDEQAAIRQTLRGSTAQNLTRKAGKMSPDRGGVMANLSMMQAGAAGLTGNPLFLAPAAVGAVAKPVSDHNFQRVVKELAARIAQGKPIEMRNATPEQLAIAKALAAQIGGATASSP